jgi:hypothetical protein
MISAMQWSARCPDTKLLQLLVNHCPSDVMAEVGRNLHSQGPSSATVDIPASSKFAGTSSTRPTLHSDTTSREYAAAIEEPRAPPLPGAYFAQILSEWPMLLLVSLLLLTLVGMEAARSATWVTERNVLYVVIWMVAFVLFPWAHKALLQKTFDRVFYQAARYGLSVSTSMSFTDDAVQRSYGRWVIHNMGCLWWLFVEGVQLWCPLLAQLKKSVYTSQNTYRAFAVIILVCLLSCYRWKAIRRGDLETMQWASVSICLAMHSKLAPAWSAQAPPFFSFSWPYFLASMFGLRLGICLLQLLTELAPMVWLHSTRFVLSVLTAGMVGSAISTSQYDQPHRVFQPVVLYYLAVGGFHWLTYWVLRFLLEGNRMSRYIQYVHSKVE